MSGVLGAAETREYYMYVNKYEGTTTTTAAAATATITATTNKKATYCYV